jgi:hypothetical protein
MKIKVNRKNSRIVGLDNIVDAELVFSHEAGDKFFHIDDFIEYIEAYDPEKRPEGSVTLGFRFTDTAFDYMSCNQDGKIVISDQFRDAIKESEKDYQDDPNKNKVIKDQFWEKINKWDKWFTELEETRIYKFSSCDNEGITLKN